MALVKSCLAFWGWKGHSWPLLISSYNSRKARKCSIGICQLFLGIHRQNKMNQYELGALKYYLIHIIFILGLHLSLQFRWWRFFPLQKCRQDILHMKSLTLAEWIIGILIYSDFSKGYCELLLIKRHDVTKITASVAINNISQRNIKHFYTKCWMVT